MRVAFPHQSNGLSGFAGAVGGIFLGLFCGLMVRMGLGVVVQLHDGRLVLPEESQGWLAVVWLRRVRAVGTCGGMPPGMWVALIGGLEIRLLGERVSNHVAAQWPVAECDHIGGPRCVGWISTGRCLSLAQASAQSLLLVPASNPCFRIWMQACPSSCWPESSFECRRPKSERI